jgi:thioredoxin:protein disulfide reductase
MVRRVERGRRLLLAMTWVATVSWAVTAVDAQVRRPRAEVTPIAATDAAHAGSTVRLGLRVSLPQGLHTQSDAPRDPGLIATVLTVDAPEGVDVEAIAYPPAQDLEQEGASEPLAVFEHEFVIGVRATIAAGRSPGDLVIPGRLRYQACDDKLCYPPVTTDVEWRVPVVPASTPLAPTHAEAFAGVDFARAATVPAPRPPAPPSVAAAVPAPADGVARLDRFDVVATTGGYIGRDDFLQFIDDAERGVTRQGLFEGRGPLAILVIVLLGGLALNLTPCVLPMIPINLAIIGAGTQAGSRRRGFLLGSAYGAAMALVYGVLGLIVILTAGSFGTINASPWFNLAIAVLFVALGLAMFDLFEIDFSRFSSGFRADADRRGSFALAFTMGGVAALLAGACVAPVVIQVVLFSSSLYAAGTAAALALPFCLGLGMAIPWPIAGAGLASLPRPGAWMVRVKQAFGVLILGTAVYYGYLAYELFANRWVDASAVESSVETMLKDGWHASLAEGLAVAEAEGKPVLVDMWATWCKNCLTMDKTTLADAQVKSALDGYVRIKFQAEDPDAEPARSVMQRFNAVGLPTYAILRPRSAAGRP